MCGIIAFAGARSASPILIHGLKRLEYRGYDSAGIALFDGSDLRIYKKNGKVSILDGMCQGQNLSGNIGIGHTRWATHGKPSDVNAHPHISYNGFLALVHNGTLEQYQSTKQLLIDNNVQFTSETDTEVLAHLIAFVMERDTLTIIEAVRTALGMINGTYAIVVLTKDGQLVAACNGSTLVIGEGENLESNTKEYYFASGPEAFMHHTKTTHTLKDGEMAWLDTSGLHIEGIQDGEQKTPNFIELEYDVAQIEKGGYEHFMLKEIHEQPRAIRDCLEGRIDPTGQLRLSVIDQILKHISQNGGIDRIVVVACGTSYHSGLLMRMFEPIIGKPVVVETAAEFRYRKPFINQHDLVVFISQSGSTADTLAAVEYVKGTRALRIGICNVVGSAIPRQTDTGIYTHAGPEIGVASTKAFTAQVTALTLLSIALGVMHNTITRDAARDLLRQLQALPEIVGEVIESAQNQVSGFVDYINRPIVLPWYVSFLRPFLKRYEVTNVLFLGRGYGYPLALEGALKLKEVSYINAEGISAAEMKHGPIATIEPGTPVVFIATAGDQYEKVLNNMHEIKARGGKILGIVTQGDTLATELCDFVITVPKVHEMLTPQIVAPVLQLIAYDAAVGRNTNVDQPKNLAKSVTVE